jgi:hypothetical protein
MSRTQALHGCFEVAFALLAQRPLEAPLRSVDHTVASR